MGALRRENVAETASRHLEVEIEQQKWLVWPKMVHLILSTSSSTFNSQFVSLEETVRTHEFNVSKLNNNKNSSDHIQGPWEINFLMKLNES